MRESSIWRRGYFFVVVDSTALIAMRRNGRRDVQWWCGRRTGFLCFASDDRMRSLSPTSLAANLFPLRTDPGTDFRRAPQP